MDDLRGAWRLESFTAQLEDGTVIHPMGPDAQGQLIYTADGHMSAMLSRGDRAPLAIERLESFARASVDEKAAAFDSFLSYGGTYVFSGGTVTHSVEVASVPNIVGVDQVRQVALGDDSLTLSYAIVTPRGRRRNVLRWVRIGVR